MFKGEAYRPYRLRYNNFFIITNLILVLFVSNVLIVSFFGAIGTIRGKFKVN
ncbi:MAG: hypothetical protein LBH59_02465 [Planctomycetaceae bacterium]|nr:hypothetical protein [Planctomycetaceae bacterium]